MPEIEEPRLPFRQELSLMSEFVRRMVMAVYERDNHAAFWLVDNAHRLRFPVTEEDDDDGEDMMQLINAFSWSNANHIDDSSYASSGYWEELHDKLYDDDAYYEAEHYDQLYKSLPDEEE
jgi:hypothetical protein